MADELLSQEEINLLLQTLGKEEEKKAALEERRVKPLDLYLFETISAGRIPGLELIFERWMNGLRRGLASLMVAIPNIFKESVTLSRFGEFTAKLPLPCAVGLFSVEPLRGLSLIAIDPKLIYIAVSSIFGGGVKPYRIEGKDFTRIELRIIQRLLNVCYHELELAWSSLMEVKINPVGIETNPALLTMARAKEKFILLKLVVAIENSEGYIYLAIPENSIAPYREILKGTAEIKSKHTQEQMNRTLKGIPLRFEAVLGYTKISMQRLLELKKGDVIVLDKQVKEPLEIKVEGKTKMLSFYGQVGIRKAVKIFKYSTEEEKNGRRK